MTEWFTLCLSRPILKRASLTALIVGFILIIINHGDAILKGQLDASRIFKISLTVLVPYLVSTYSSVSTIMSLKKGNTL